jgi:hypothetical protein
VRWPPVAPTDRISARRRHATSQPSPPLLRQCGLPQFPLLFPPYVSRKNREWPGPPNGVKCLVVRPSVGFPNGRGPSIPGNVARGCKSGLPPARRLGNALVVGAGHSSPTMGPAHFEDTTMYIGGETLQVAMMSSPNASPTGLSGILHSKHSRF